MKTKLDEYESVLSLVDSPSMTPKVLRTIVAKILDGERVDNAVFDTFRAQGVNLQNLTPCHGPSASSNDQNLPESLIISVNGVKTSIWRDAWLDKVFYPATLGKILDATRALRVMIPLCPLSTAKAHAEKIFDLSIKKDAQNLIL